MRPGVTVRAIAQLDGETGFAEVFFDDARVPVANRLGPENQGWKVAMATAGFERGLMLRSPARYQATARKLVEFYTSACGGRRSLPARRRRTRLAERGSLRPEHLLDGVAPHAAAAASAPRRASTRSSGRRWTCTCTRRRWPCSARVPSCCRSAPDAGNVGDWLDGFLFALAGPIYAGTNEIQRNVIAERLLNLPKG